MHVTDNPFIADEASASDMLNVYVDDNNALTVRPRLEKNDDYDSIIGDYTLIKVEPLKNGKILLLLNGTTPVVKLIINNTTYTVSGVGTINVNTCNFYEDGDISVDGKIYLFDENGAKYIKKDGSAYVCGSISDIAYTPTVEVNKDLALGKTTEKEPYNAFSTNYKISYATKETPYDTDLSVFVNKKVTLNTAYNNVTKTFTPQNIETIQFWKTICGVDANIIENTHKSMDKSGKTLIYTIPEPINKTYVSTDYGITFELFSAIKDGVSYIPNDVIKAWVSGDGTTIVTLSASGVLTRFKNKIYTGELDTVSYVKNNITYSSTKPGTSVSYINDIMVSMNFTGNKIAFNYMFNMNGSAVKQNVMIADETLTVDKIYEMSASDNRAKYLYMNNNGNFCVYAGIDATTPAFIIDTTLSQMATSTQTNPNAFTIPYNDNYIGLAMATSAANCAVWLNDICFAFLGGYQTTGANPVVDKVCVVTITNSTILSGANFSLTSIDSNPFSNPHYPHLFVVNGYLYLSDNDNVMKKYELSVTNGSYIVNGNPVSLRANIDGWVLENRLTSTTIISGGIFYDINTSLQRIYTNNNYSKDIDWLTVEYTDHTSDYKINKSTNYAIWRDSLWLYGYKNQLGWSGYVNGNRDFTYFPEDQIFELGIDTTPLGEKSDITGFNVVGDNVASAYKRNKIYLIQPTTVNNRDTYLYSECKAEQGNDTMGQTVVTPLSALPIQVNRDGVFALTNLTNVYAADKVATLISGKINEKFLKEDLSNIKLIAFKYWLFIFIPSDISKVYVYDDRFSEWYYWELPIKVLNVFKTHDNLYCVSDDNVVFKFNSKEKLVNIDASDAVTLYYDDVYVEGEDNCFDAYGVQGKNVVWYWTSQILPLNSVSHAKQLSKTTFIVADSDVTDGYAFNFSIKGWRKKRTLVKSSDLDGTVYSVQATTKRTNINRAHFIQLTVTNAMLENHQLVLSKTLKTDIDTNDQKVRLIGVSFKYKYLEV